MLPGTAHSWLEAISEGREFVADRDASRIRAAFRTLATTRESWPAPRHLIDALPRIEQQAIAYEVKPLSKEEADKRLASIRALLNEPMPTFKPEPPRREGPPLAEVEQDLRLHYGTDRKSAAAGDAS